MLNLQRLKSFIKGNVVFCIALFAALLTMLWVPPSIEYKEYFDFKTLTCLFCTLAFVCALMNINFFKILAHKIVRVFHSIRSCILAIVYITFIGSMLIANDMALITFLPLGYFVLKETRNEKYMAFTFIMQNIAANLGGMLTPFGNPQNLYLYSHFNIPTIEFFEIMFLPFILSVLGITICCMFVKSEKLQLPETSGDKLPLGKTVIYLLLFTLSIVIVFRFIPYWVGLIVIPVGILLFDRKALKDVDYGLLLTFCAFFVFSNNMSRIPAVNDLLSSIVNINPLLVGVTSCQFISNVPSAILLSQFTENYRQLLVAVNIGGAGTLIASLASLITFKEYVKVNPEGSKSYLKLFSWFNFGFVITLTIIMSLVFIYA